MAIAEPIDGEEEKSSPLPLLSEEAEECKGKQEEGACRYAGICVKTRRGFSRIDVFEFVCRAQRCGYRTRAVGVGSTPNNAREGGRSGYGVCGWFRITYASMCLCLCIVCV